MAPEAIDPSPPPAAALPAYKGPTAYKDASGTSPETFNRHAEEHGTGTHAGAKYPHYLPVWDKEVKYPPLEPFEHYEHGKDADPSFPNLLPPGRSQVSDLTGNIGAEVHGVQLSALSDKGRDELALFVAQKKVVAFRNQDLSTHPIPTALTLGTYFGRLHIHPTSGHPPNHPEIHLVYRSSTTPSSSAHAQDFLTEHTTSVAWHSDVTYEAQPPGTTFLYLLEGPSSAGGKTKAGGDTLFVNAAEAYRRLSPAFRRRLHGLRAVHSGVQQAEQSLGRGGVVRREAVGSVHPVVRTHPVTGEKALFVNAQFTRRILDLKQEESDALLKFLFDHIALGADFQARVKWAPGTVVVWDNRVTGHSALVDWEDGSRRHLARITPQAERPYETPFEEDDVGVGEL
ncbi:alpha-ketoglutarate-dependent taurine dioxygenase [Pseudovirgaria hyperparasitica]|uniref:Alpha-ketoglutarate-dependent taurine dioxygenase n=1 Tax=Pseudovirgaria hyperparasitica TaxID=470096 RepID=A0A6A6WCR1_9PEZI|nr:alpha-ketoglutarate-dependent taurine dioxygenase [Pseudovirgaria hyperparasitica]KAF2760493.1 alpha-ketoglutarate-dependent taurine dioxygenase [Pseudovirgaria hyperparasitica]